MIRNQAFFCHGATLNVERYRHTATPAAQWQSLLAGGQNSIINRTQSFSIHFGGFDYTTGSMTSPRDAHTATLLSDGKVLLAGGLDGNCHFFKCGVYDPATDTFIPAEP